MYLGNGRGVKWHSTFLFGRSSFFHLTEILLSRVFKLNHNTPCNLYCCFCDLFVKPDTLNDDNSHKVTKVKNRDSFYLHQSSFEVVFLICHQLEGFNNI